MRALELSSTERPGPRGRRHRAPPCGGRAAGGGHNVAMGVLLEVDAIRGFVAGFDEVPVALQSLRRRQLDLCGRLDADDWRRPSRCHLWTVHDVVRHVRDACRLHVQSLHGSPTPFTPGNAFNSRETPLRWLDRTAGQTPTETVAELVGLCAEEEAALEVRLEHGGDDLVDGPYGPIHWTTLTAHVFWDAWLHHRDVTEALGLIHRSSAVEDRVVALYGLLLASVPAAVTGRPLDVTVGLMAGRGARYSASVRPAKVVLGSADAYDEPALRGQLRPVVDALAGRRPGLEVVLHGEQSDREPLTWLATILLPEADGNRGA